MAMQMLADLCGTTRQSGRSARRRSTARWRPGSRLWDGILAAIG